MRVNFIVLLTFVNRATGCIVIFVLHGIVITESNALLDIYLVVIRLHLLVKIGLFIVDNLLELVLNCIHTIYNFLDAFYLTVDFFRVLANLSALVEHLLEKRLFHSLRIVANHLDHYILERFNLFMFLLIIFNYVFLVLFI